MNRTHCLFLAIILVFGLFPGPGLGQPNYYQGKTIKVMSGRNPGGVGDIRLRAMLPFLQKYIPGNPSVIAEYMPGAGGRKVANHVYTSSKNDGLTIVSVSPGIIASAVLGMSGVQYDPIKFIYLGSPFSENNNLFVTGKAIGLNNLDKLRKHAGLRIGGQSVGHVQFIRSRLFAWLMNLKEPNFVVGYSGPELDVALGRGEIDARAAAVDATSLAADYNKTADIHAILEIPKGSRPAVFANVPEIASFARSPIEKDVLTMSRAFWGVGTLAFMPPNTPDNLVKIVRQGVRRTFEDKQFHREYKKLVGTDVSPLMPEEQQKLVEELPRRPEVIKAFSAIANMGPLPPRE